jgi:Co/Zn/Cd efflux system component
LRGDRRFVERVAEPIVALPSVSPVKVLSVETIKAARLPAIPEQLMQRTHAHGQISALLLVAGIAAIEIIGGLNASSLSLLADATGLIAYAVEWALALRSRVAAFSRQCELARFDQAVALVLTVTALCLFASVWILCFAYFWSLEPPEIRAETMLMTAIAGLIGSVSVMAFRREGHCPDAPTERLSDIGPKVLVGPLQVVVAATLVMVTGWSAIDRIVATAIALYVILRMSALGYCAIRHWLRRASATKHDNERKGKNCHG